MKSREFEYLARNEENETKAKALLQKAVREKRYEKFKYYFIKKVSDKFVIYYDEFMCRYTIKTEKFGDLDFFPKSDTLIIRNNNGLKNKKINHGMEFIRKYLLDEVDTNNNNPSK